MRATSERAQNKNNNNTHTNNNMNDFRICIHNIKAKQNKI